MNHFLKRPTSIILIIITSMMLSACKEHPSYEKAKEQNTKNILHKATKNSDAQPVIWIGDFNNFDDTLALMLVAKDPRYKIELVVVEESFNNVAQGIDTTYNILEWLGNLDTKIIRGSYFAQEEITMGANGDKEVGTAVHDKFSVASKDDYQIPNSLDSKSKRWNLERRNVMGINLFGQYIPGPWRDNGSSLYATKHLIPRATQSNYHYKSDNKFAFDYIMAEDMILKSINNLNNVVILNTGKMTTMARFLAKASKKQLAKIESVYIMGGGFQGIAPFTSDNKASCYGNRSRNLGGHIFPDPSFNCDSDFSTHQEYNLFLDAKSAQESFNLLSLNKVSTWLIPTNASDLAKVEKNVIAKLSAEGATSKACYASKLFINIHKFEGGDFNGHGDFALDNVIRLWDVIAAIALLEPKLIIKTQKAFVDVNQLDEGLQESDTPYDPLTFDPMVGKTTMKKQGAGQALNIVLEVDIDASRDAMVKRLRSTINSAVKQVSCVSVKN